MVPGQDLKDTLNNAVETENPPGTDYYGTEVNENDVKAAREQMDETTRTHEEVTGNTPDTRTQKP